jgi:hemerythrin
MTIDWNDKLAIGNETIDDDHKHLIQLINAYELAVSKNNLKVLGLAFASLEDYANEHFSREEKIMEAVHYPHRRSHREEHKKLLQDVHKKHEELVKGSESVDVEGLSAFLRNWLIGHVIKEDMQLKPFVMGGRKD